MPFIRLSDDYDEHPKIARLSDGAFRLWHQAVAYSRRYETDGVVAMAILKTRTAYTASRVAELVKPHRDGANALLRLDGDDAVIHDYLEWNHSREESQAKRARDTQRVKRHRNAASNGVGNAPCNALHNANVAGMGMDQEKEGDPKPVAAVIEMPTPAAPVSRVQPRRLGRGVMAGELPSDHLRHEVCGRVCLPDFKFRAFAQKVGGADAEARVRTWATGVLDAWSRPPFASQPVQGSDLQWWDARYAEWHGLPASASVAPAGRVVPSVDATAALLAEIRAGR